MSNSTPAPAQSLTFLTADILCVECHRLLEEVANFKSYHRFEQFNDALRAYVDARFDGIMDHTEPSKIFYDYIKGHGEPDPQKMTRDWEPAPETVRSEVRT